MFDRHYQFEDSRRPRRVEVHEHRAPTDQSVRLLAEMEQAARNKVLASIRLENCPIDAVVHMYRDPRNADREFLVQFQVGGNRLEVRKVFRMFDNEETIAKGLMEAVSERIAAEILAPALTALQRQIGGVL